MKIKESELKAIIAEVIKDVIEDNSKVNEGNMKRMAMEIMDELQAIAPPDVLQQLLDVMEQYGLGVKDLQGILQDMAPMSMNEGLMDTLNYLFTGKTPSELDLIQRELDKAKANLNKPSMAGDQSRKAPAADSKNRELQLKLMKLKAARKASE